MNGIFHSNIIHPRDRGEGPQDQGRRPSLLPGPAAARRKNSGGAISMIIQVMDSKTNPCRRCGGSLSIENDQFGTYLRCLMCSRETELQQAQGMTFRMPNPILDIHNLQGA